FGLGRVRLGEAVVVVGHSLVSRPGGVLKIMRHAAHPGMLDRSGCEQYSGRTFPDAALGRQLRPGELDPNPRALAGAAVDLDPSAERLRPPPPVPHPFAP